MPNFKIGAPENNQEFDLYYDLRWRILRAPWNQPRGSEKDDFEDEAHHVCVKSHTGEIIGVGRLHTIEPGLAQIRYMAVDESHRQQGVGKLIYDYLEAAANESGIKKIKVDARDHAVGFYETRGFHITGEGHTLFNEIKHKIMEKTLNTKE